MISLCVISFVCLFSVFVFVLFCLDISCLLFSEVPGSVVLYLTFYWGDSQSFFLQHFFLSFLSLFPFWYSHYVYIIPLVVVPQIMDILFWFFVCFFPFLFAFRFSRIRLMYLLTQRFSHVQSTKKPIKGILTPVMRLFI